MSHHMSPVIWLELKNSMTGTTVIHTYVWLVELSSVLVWETRGKAKLHRILANMLCMDPTVPQRIQIEQLPAVKMVGKVSVGRSCLHQASEHQGRLKITTTVLLSLRRTWKERIKVVLMGNVGLQVVKNFLLTVQHPLHACHVQRQVWDVTWYGYQCAAIDFATTAWENTCYRRYVKIVSLYRVLYAQPGTIFHLNLVVRFSCLCLSFKSLDDPFQLLIVKFSSRLTLQRKITKCFRSGRLISPWRWLLNVGTTAVCRQKPKLYVQWVLPR